MHNPGLLPGAQRKACTYIHKIRAVERGKKKSYQISTGMMTTRNDNCTRFSIASGVSERRRVWCVEYEHARGALRTRRRQDICVRQKLLHRSIQSYQCYRESAHEMITVFGRTRWTIDIVRPASDSTLRWPEIVFK